MRIRKETRAACGGTRQDAQLLEHVQLMMDVSDFVVHPTARGLVRLEHELRGLLARTKKKQAKGKS